MNTYGHNGMICDYNVETPMRDGVLLRGDLYMPSERGKYPLLLWRTIFRKNTLARAFAQYDPAHFVRNGYAVFIQDVRGLGESDGEFDRFTADGKDGCDTIEWLAQQDFCDGNVGMIGSYYAGYLQLMAAAEHPAHLKAICPMQTSVSINRDCDNRGFLFYSHIGWCMSRQISRLRDGRYDEATTQKYLPMLLDYIRDYPTRQLMHRPICEMPVLTETPFPIFKDYYRHLVEGYDNFDLLHKEGRDMDVSGIHIPAFYISGWYDSARNAMIAHCRTQRNSGTDSRVLIAPWQQGEPPVRADNALETGESIVDIQQDMVQWFDCWLKGHQAPAWQAYRYYDIATRTGWEGEYWSDGDSELHNWYLQSDGQLCEQAAIEGENEYVHDPQHPLSFVPYGATGRLVATGADTLQYVTQPVDRPFIIHGLVRARVYLSSDAKDADVVMRLCDIGANQTKFVVCDGATRARYRNSWTSEPLESGKVYAIDVLLGHTHYQVQEGHRLALEIMGSAFSKYDVNTGTAERPACDTGFVVSHNHIHLSGEYPSCLQIPLMAEE